MRQIRWVVSLLGVFFMCSALHAQSLAHHFELFAEGGASFSNQLARIEINPATFFPPTFAVSTNRESLGTTGRLFTGLRFWLGSHQAIEASYSYTPANLAFSRSCIANCFSFKSAPPLRASFFAGNYVHTLPKLWRMRPFLTSGVGLVYFANAVALSNTAFTVNLGGGFDFAISRHWSVRAEYRDWIFAMPSDPKNDPESISGLIHNSVSSAGIVYRF